MKEDLALIQDVLKNRTRAVDRLYDRYADSLLSLCFRYTGNLQDAEDVLHEGFIKIIKSLPDFQVREGRSPEGWMKKIMVNTALNFLRDHKQDRFSPGIEQVPENSNIDYNDEDEMEWSHLPLDQEQIMALIADLPPGYRTVFNLYVFEDFSHKEISGKLNCTESTSKSQLSKARALLRTRIKELISIHHIK